jgi:Transcriptional Coactivator p15 (PC4)
VPDVDAGEYFDDQPHGFRRSYEEPETILCTFPRGKPGALDKNVNQFRIARYKGHPYVDARALFRDDTGEQHATKRGITIRMSELPEAIAALQRALLILTGAADPAPVVG